MRNRRLLILCPFPNGRAPSQRFRFEQYVEAWEREGFEVVQAPFWDERTFAVLYKKGFTGRKVLGFMRGLARRAKTMLATGQYDYVFIHLGAVPAGPPLVEALCMLRNWRVIYDIDDAIFLGAGSTANPIVSLLRSGAYVEFVAKHAHKVVVVNPFLASWAQRLNDDVRLIPTTIDPRYHRPRPAGAVADRIVLGWTGTFMTNPYLDIVREALAELQKERAFTLRVISNVDPGFPDLANYEFVPWRKETEIEDLWPIDVGLMPVPEVLTAKAKVGFKAIQYSALEIPSIVSDAGSGREVVEDGVTGFVVKNDTAAWLHALRTLIDAPELRRRMAAAARDRIMARYSVPAQESAYRSLLRD
jgi:glycosyltransferase involved in cell wall biosynthesis